MNIIKEFLYIIPLSAVIVSISTVINNWNSHELEKLLMTTYKKLSVSFATILFSSIAAGSFVGIQISVETEDWKLSTFIISFAVVFLLLFFSIAMSNVLVRFLTHQHQVHVHLPDGNCWSLIRVTPDKRLLVGDQQGRFKIVAPTDDVVYELKKKPNRVLSKFYEQKWLYWSAIGVQLLVIIGLFIVLRLTSTEPILVIVSLILILFSLSMLIMMLYMVLERIQAHRNKAKQMSRN